MQFKVDVDTRRDSSREAVQLIQDKLNRAIIAIHRAYGSDGQPLDPALQRAVRILRSRQRLLDRLWQAEYGVPELAARARLELSLSKQDTGELLKFGEKQHSVGRLDCRSCDSETNPDNAFGLRSLASVCNECKGGVLHVIAVLEAVNPEVPSLTTIVGEVIDPTLVLSRTSPIPSRLVRVYLCDNCGFTERICIRDLEV